MKVRITFQSPLTTIGEKGAGCVELLLAWLSEVVRNLTNKPDQT